MAQRTGAGFKANIAGQFVTNTSGLNTAAKVRTHLGEDIADSFLNRTDDLLDEDDMASDSATKVPSQQSVKAYVDAQVGGGVLTTTVTVSSAEILALNATPKTLIAAPGANKVIQVAHIYIFYDYGSAAYTQNSGVVTIRYAPGISVNSGGLTCLTGTQDQYLVPALNTVTSAVNAGNINQPVYITNSVADPTDGDGELKVSLIYRIIDLA